MKKISFIMLLVLVLAAAYTVPSEAEVAETNALPATPGDTTAAVRDSVATELQEVTVIQSNVKRKGKESSYKVTEALRKGCRNTGEVIGKLEGVFYEPITKTISYIGSQNIVLLVDSVKKDASYIKRINPNRIDRITIVSNPIGEYSGYDAVINIHRIPDYIGYEGNVGADTQIITGNRNGKGHPFMRLGALADFTYTWNKLTVAASVNLGRFNDAYSFVNDTRYPYNDLVEKTVVPNEDDPTTRNFDAAVNIQVSADYEINKKNYVSVLWNIIPSKSYLRQKEEMLYGNPAKELETITYENNSEKKNQIYNDINLYYRGKFDLWQLNSHLCYTNTSFDSYNEVSRSNGYSLADNRENKFDMLWGGASVRRNSANGKWSFYLSDYLGYSKFEYFRLGTDNRLSSNSELDNNTQLSVSFYPTDNFGIGVEPGLRVYAESSGDLSDTYVRPTFSAWASYSPKSSVWMRLYYKTSAVTPTLRNMSGYGQFTDSLIYSSGNPLLKPYRYHRVSLTVSPLRNLVISGSYTRTLDEIYEYSGLGYGRRPDNIEGYYIDKTFVNGSGGNWNISASYQLQFLKYWNLNVGAQVTSKWGKYADFENSKTMPSGHCMLTYSNERLGQFMWGYGIISDFTMTPQMSVVSKGDLMRIGYNKSFLKNRLNLQIAYGVPLNIIKQSSKKEFYSEGLQTVSYNPYLKKHHNDITIELVYSFGNGKEVRRFEHNRNSVNY